MLKLEQISKTFYPGTADEKKALDHCSLHVKKGEFVTIIGSNGAGKSTLFNLISGALFPDSGRILLDGNPITYQQEYQRAGRIGHVFQDPMRGTAPSMTVEENLTLACLRGRKSRFSIGISQKERAFFREQLAQLDLGLEDRMKSPVKLLSGGQRQAVALLMCTLSAPKLLLLDEHTAALDPATAEKVLAITNRVVEENGLTAMMITHNISSALSLGNRTLMMDQGQIVLDLSGEKRQNMTVPMVLEQFHQRRNKAFDTDRVLL